MTTNLPKNILSISVLLLLNMSSISWGGNKQAVYSKHGFNADLDDVIPAYEVKNETILHAYAWLTGYVSFGVEYKDYGPNEQPKRFSLKLSSPTIRDVLNALVEKDPDYFWEMNNNVVNIIPKAPAGKDKYLISVLNKKLPQVKISIHNEEPLVKLAVIELINIIRAHGDDPEISLTAIPPDVRDYMVQNPSPKGYSLSVSLNNPSIRETLNAIVKADPPSGWMVEYFEDGIGIDAFLSHAHRRGILIPAKKDMRFLKNPKRKEWGKPANQ